MRPLAIFPEMIIKRKRYRKMIDKFTIVILFSIISQVNASESKLYYVKYDIETENGVFTESRLSMLPASNEFRVNNFKAVRVMGTI